jgi:hypothetical protein
VSALGGQRVFREFTIGDLHVRINNGGGEVVY